MINHAVCYRAFEAKVSTVEECIVGCPLEPGDTLDVLKELLTISVGLEICIVVLLIYSIVILININISKKRI